MIISSNEAIALLQRNEIVAIPTETVYGLAADARSDLAVTKIYERKQRPAFNPLIIHVKNLEQAKELAYFSNSALKLAEFFWTNHLREKPLTIVLPKKNNYNISSLALAGLDTIALRVPKHPIALEILKKCNFPLAAPSANPSKHISPTDVDTVIKGLPEIPVVDGGPCLVGLESTIIDLTGASPTILRPGAVTIEELQSILNCSINLSSSLSAIKAPGMMKRHYAPSLPLRLNANEKHLNEALLGFGQTDLPVTLNLSIQGDLNEAASNLFKYLGQLDNPIYKGIAVMPIPEKGLGMAINDRLKRAAYSK